MNQSVEAVARPAARTAHPQTRRGRAIQRALPILGSAVARQCGVEVRFGSPQPMRIDRTIHLPNLPFDDPEVEILALGYLLHEAAHIRYDDGPAVTTTALQESLRKLLQDPVDERKLGQDYPGFKYRLQQLVEKLVQTGDFDPPRGEDPPVVKLKKYLLYRLRAVMVGQEVLSDYASQAEVLFRNAFPPGACVRIGAVIGRVPQLRKRQEVADLAQEIVEIIEDESQEPPASESPRSDEPREDGDADSHSDNSMGANATAGGDDDQPGSADGAETDSKTTSNDSSLDVDKGNGLDTEIDPAAEQRANLRSILGADAADFGPEIGNVLSDALKEQAAQAVLQGSGGGVGRAESALVEPQIDPAEVLAEVNDATIALRTRLSALVESSRQQSGGYARRGTRIAPRRYVAALCGDPRIFRHRRVDVAVNTRVAWLLDRSKSMEEADRIAIARQSVLAAAVTLETIPGITQTIGAFPGFESDVELITGDSQSVKRTAARYRAITPCGGTPLLPALLWAVDQLLVGPEPRKLLIVVTDGEPDPASTESCKEVIQRCWDSAIEVYGIGIRVADIRELFPMSRSINELEDLAPAIFGLLEDALTRRSAA